MTRAPLYGSLTRISDLESDGYEVAAVDRDRWRMGDYVLARVLDTGAGRRVEFSTGRQAAFEPGDTLVGALGVRHATLEATGDWRAVGPDLEMHLLTGAGLFGLCTSRSEVIGALARIEYVGHAVRGGRPVKMKDFVPELDPVPYTTPTVLIIGTSMSAGKTTAARIVVRLLREAGLRVAGAKLTGAGRFRDILTMQDAGAEPIVDFVDAGLPSSVCERSRFDAAASHMLTRIQTYGTDAAVIEAGASPLEPYNGMAAIEALKGAIGFTILAASDPYAVLGVMEAFDVKPDLVTGITANTLAGIELVERMTGIPTVNVRDPEEAARLGPRITSALEALNG